MNFDPEALKRMSETDKGELYSKIDEISRLLGADPAVIRRMVGDPDSIKEKLENLSDEDVRRMTSRLDPKTLERLSRQKEKRNGK